MYGNCLENVWQVSNGCLAVWRVSGGVLRVLLLWLLMFCCWSCFVVVIILVHRDLSLKFGENWVNIISDILLLLLPLF